MDWFISTTPERPRPLYIHAVVYTPINAVQSVRKTVYRLINQTIPPAARSCLSFVRHRIRFTLIHDRIEEEVYQYPYDHHEVTFTHIRFSHYWSPAYHPEDHPYTTNTPPTPPASPEASPER